MREYPKALTILTIEKFSTQLLHLPEELANAQPNNKVLLGEGHRAYLASTTGLGGAWSPSVTLHESIMPESDWYDVVHRGSVSYIRYRIIHGRLGRAELPDIGFLLLRGITKTGYLTEFAFVLPLETN